jgi:hypothetical protein
VHDSATSRGRGEQRPVSRRELLKYACSAPVLAGLGTLAATPYVQKASAANMRLIDFAERRIPPDQIKSAGYDGVVNYVSESRPGANFEAKPITREYADALRAASLQIVSNFQYGKALATLEWLHSHGFERLLPKTCDPSTIPGARV